MESIEQMIKRLCPSGVKYEKLRDICEIRRGVRVVKKQLSDRDGYPVYQNSLTSLGMYQSSNRKSGTTFVICAGAAGEIGYCNTEFWAADDCSTVESDALIDRFIYFYLMTKQSKLKSQVRKASVPRLSRDAIENLSIPVPPLEIQNRIVEVLDKMTTLTAELEAELEARKQQYEYYRNKLLTFNEIGGGGIRQVTWMKINEIGTIYRGIAYSKKDFTETGTPCIHYGQIYTRYGTFANKTFTYVSEELANGKRLAKKGDLVMAVTSENMEDVGKCLAWLGEDDILVSNHACFIRHSLNPKYLAYFLQTSYFFNYKKKISKGVKVIDLDLNMFGDMLIPVPSMEEQERIVSILDRFEALTTDLRIGLPAEIEARRQQYEYYRNKLLTFDQAA